MDSKNFMTTLVIMLLVMLAFSYFMRGGGGGGGASATKPLAIYEHLPEYGPDDKDRPSEDHARPEMITLGNAGRASKDKTAVEVSNELASINQVQLNINDYAETVKRQEPYTLMAAAQLPGGAKMPRPFSTIGIHVTVGNSPTELAYGKGLTEEKKKRLQHLLELRDGGALTAADAKELDDLAKTISFANSTNLLDAQYVWKVLPRNQGSYDASMMMRLAQNDVPVAEVVKTFHVDKDSYHVEITHTVKNLLPPHVVTKPARDKTIELGSQNVSNVVVKAGEQVKAPGKDYTVDAAKGQVTVVPEGTIGGADVLTVSFYTPRELLHVAIDQLGPQELPRDDPQTDDRSFHAVKLLSGKKVVDTDHPWNLGHPTLRKTTAVNGGTATVGDSNGQLWDFANDPVLWVGSANRFFAAVVRPEAQTGDTATYMLEGGHPIPEPSHVATGNVDLIHVALSPDQPSEDVAGLRLTGRTLDVPPGAEVSEPLAVYFGPKKPEILQGAISAPVGTLPYDHAAYQYVNLIQYQQGCYSYCVKDWVVGPILWALEFFKRWIAFGNYGVAIMILVIVVRAALHPLTRASQVSMAKMGKQMRDVQPQLEAMKRKYADNKKKQSEEMMRIYRENHINPAGGVLGCLPMMIQIPIWAALYSGLRMDIDLRHAAFIPGWINDLSNPDTVWPSSVIHLGQPAFTVPIIGMAIYGLNLLPLLLTVVFYFQMKVTTATQPKATDEQQAQMQKMSQYMVFLFPLFLYNAPSGLNLYIFASTMGGLLDTYIVRKALKKQGILAPSAALLPTHEDADNK